MKEIEPADRESVIEGGATLTAGLIWVVDAANRNGLPAARIGRLPRSEALGAVYPVASTRRARLLGLALLERREAGAGLLIPGCRSVHTFGMRFPIDVWFLGPCGEPIAVRRSLGPARVVRERAARSVLEVPA